MSAVVSPNLGIVPRSELNIIPGRPNTRRPTRPIRQLSYSESNLQPAQLRHTSVFSLYVFCSRDMFVPAINSFSNVFRLQGIVTLLTWRGGCTTILPSLDIRSVIHTERAYSLRNTILPLDQGKEPRSEVAAFQPSDAKSQWAACNPSVSRCAPH
ncbi:hypothetical protein QCA50_009528 [Cerrena zonata]|uniref:Uncharacterized protein n=1 Tax=Cerrena zonata TaxID=2478898 RepID=A0AAW0G141_9APHY